MIRQFADRFAAAAAVQDPSLMLRLRAAERTPAPQRPNPHRDLGVDLDGELLAAAATSAVTWGIVLAYAVGKPFGLASTGRIPRLEPCAAS